MIWLLLSMFSIFTVDTQASCGGKRLPFMERVEKADLIFVGKMATPLQVAKDAPKGTNRLAKVNVLNVFKGDPGKEVDIYVYSPPKECGWDSFKALEEKKAQELEVLFFARERDGKYVTSQTFGSHFMFTEFAKEDVKALSKAKKLPATFGSSLNESKDKRK